jgi:hypothetical protein
VIWIGLYLNIVHHMYVVLTMHDNRAMIDLGGGSYDERNDPHGRRVEEAIRSPF